MMTSTNPIDLEDNLIDLVRGKRVLILFVGNSLRGDDGAAQLIYGTLRNKVSRMKLLDCGTSPQDYIEKVGELEPEIVFFVNAINRSLTPGAIILEELHAANSGNSSLVSHKFPLTWIAQLLEATRRRQDLATRSMLVGIQIESTKGRMTLAVLKSVKRLVRVFKKLDSIAEPIM